MTTWVSSVSSGFGHQGLDEIGGSEYACACERMCAERVVEGRQRAETQPRSGARRRHRTVPPSLSQIGGASHKWEHSAHTGFPGVSLPGGGEIRASIKPVVSPTLRCGPERRTDLLKDTQHTPKLLWAKIYVH